MIYFENDNPFGKHVIFTFTDQFENEILDPHILQQPDNHFRYESGDNALLSLILDRILDKKTITQYLQERLWNPLIYVIAVNWKKSRELATFYTLSRTHDLPESRNLYFGDWNHET